MKIEKKTAAEQAIPPIIAEFFIFSGISDTILMIMIKFFNIFSKLDWSTRKTELNFFEKLKVSNAKTEENFFKKNKLVSNDSELSR